MTKPDARPGITIPPQWSYLDIADSLNLKKKIKMNKEKILGIITIIIFGVFIYALFFIMIGWLIFAFDDMSKLLEYGKTMFFMIKCL